MTNCYDNNFIILFFSSIFRTFSYHDGKHIHDSGLGFKIILNDEDGKFNLSSQEFHGGEKKIDAMIGDIMNLVGMVIDGYSLEFFF